MSEHIIGGEGQKTYYRISIGILMKYRKYKAHVNGKRGGMKRIKSLFAAAKISTLHPIYP